MTIVQYYRTITALALVFVGTIALLNVLSLRTRNVITEYSHSRGAVFILPSYYAAANATSILKPTPRRSTGYICKHVDRPSASKIKQLKIHLPPVVTTKAMFSRVKRLLFFIGSARSGSTLMGRLLDAHPHITITNEFDLFTRWPSEPKLRDRNKLFPTLYEESAKSAWIGMKALNKQKYRGCFAAILRVPRQWQGKCDGYLEIIGDKKAQATLRAIENNSAIVNKIQSKLGLPMSFIYPLRHPLDVVATQVLRVTGNYNLYSHTDKQFHNATELKLSILRFETIVDLVQQWMDSKMLDILPVHNADLINNHKHTLETVCNFLNVTCSSDYVEDCAKVIFKESSRTRDNVYWPPELKQLLLNIVKRYKIFARYEKDF